MTTRETALNTASALEALASQPGIQLPWQETIRGGASLLREWPADAPAGIPPPDVGASAFDHDGDGKVGGSKKKVK